MPNWSLDRNALQLSWVVTVHVVYQNTVIHVNVICYSHLLRIKVTSSF